MLLKLALLIAMVSPAPTDTCNLVATVSGEITLYTCGGQCDNHRPCSSVTVVSPTGTYIGCYCGPTEVNTACAGTVSIVGGFTTRWCEPNNCFAYCYNNPPQEAGPICKCE